LVAGLFVGWEWNVVRFVLIGLAFIQLVTEFAKQRQLETVDPESLSYLVIDLNCFAVATNLRLGLYIQKFANASQLL
jgi:hypothetical protein